MKKILTVILLVIFFQLAISPSLARSIFDKFNNTNTKKWWFGYCHSNPSIYADWRVENGILVQDYGCDGALALIEDSQFSKQVVEVDLKILGPSGFGGFVIWYQNDVNLVGVGVGNGTIGVSETENGVWHGANYSFDFNINENRWVNFEVRVNSESGNLDIYADGDFFVSHHLTTSNRTGQTGLYTGNAGAYFDNFRLKGRLPKRSF